MTTIVSKTAEQQGMRVFYELLEENGRYGIRVSCGSQMMEIPDLTTEKESLLQLLNAMHLGFVTPVTARDIAEDWLLR